MIVIKAIALNTFKEAVRDKILYSLLVFAVIIISSSVLVGRLTIGQDQQVVKDIGLAAISLFGTLIATFVGTSLIHKEIRRKTTYNIISKPIRRYQFVLGKYTGLLLTVLVNLVAMVIVLFVVLALHKVLIARYLYATADLNFAGLLKAVFLMLFEMMIITSVAILFSTISTPSLSVFFTLAIYVIGHHSVDLRTMGEASRSAVLKTFTSMAYYLLPNLSNFNIRAEMVRGIGVSSSFIAFAVVYGTLYMAFVLFIAILSMERKEFI